MGPTLLALILALLPWAPQETFEGAALEEAALEEAQALWDELYGLWSTEFKRLRALREDLDEVEQVDALQLALVRQLAEVARQLAVPLHLKTFAFGTDPARFPDLGERLEWLELCYSAALLSGNESAVARAAQELSGALVGGGRRDAGHGILASALLRVAGNLPRAYLLRDLAKLERLVGDSAQALERIDELEGLLEDAPELAFMQPSLESIRSFVYIDLGVPDRATRAVHRQLENAEANTSGAPEDLLDARLVYMEWLLAVGNPEQAIEVAGLALAELPPGDGTERASLLLDRGTAEIGLEIENPERAALGAVHVAEAIALELEAGEEAHGRLSLAELHLHNGLANEAAGELTRARALIEVWGRSDERILGTLQGIELVTLEARLALLRGDENEALELARARLLAALEQMLASWSRSPERAGGVGWLLYSKRRAILGEFARLSNALEGELEGARRTLEQLMVVETLGTRARRAGLRAANLARVRSELLSEGHGMLVYLPTRGGSHVYAFDRDKMVHEETAPSFELEAALSRYMAHLVTGREALTEPEQRQWALELERRLARRVAELLLPGRIVETLGGWNGLTIVGVDALGPVPFEWLPLGRSDYLGTEIAVDSLPSLSLGLDCASRARRRIGRHDMLLVADPIHSLAVRERWPELEDLPLSDGVVATLTAPYPPERTRVLRAHEATPQSLAALDLGSIGVLQFLVHGVLERERERPLALVLSGDLEEHGLFRCEDAERSAAPRLVILSACRTAYGPTRKGDPGVADMGGAWISAGAQAVVLSRTDVAWAEALEVSSALHRSVSSGASPAEAMREALRELVMAHGAEAPFRGGIPTVVGLGQRPVFDDSLVADTGPIGKGTLALLAGAALGGLLLGLFVRRR